MPICSPLFDIVPHHVAKINFSSYSSIYPVVVGRGTDTVLCVEPDKVSVVGVVLEDTLHGNIPKYLCDTLVVYWVGAMSHLVDLENESIKTVVHVLGVWARPCIVA